MLMMMKKKYFCTTTVQSMASPSSKCGLGLISNETPARAADIPNITSASKKRDPVVIGFIDEMGGGVDGLMSCTESLGSESCGERRVDDDDGGGGCGGDDDMEFCAGESDRWRRKRSEEKRERNIKKFPPPLSSLNQNGQPCFYLKPVRKNGRLELTKVRLPRPEILRAVRENGRLRLHLVSSHVCSSKIGEEEEEENEETKPEEQLQEEEEEEEVEELWKYRVNNGQGFGRCHELVNSHVLHHRHHINDHHNSFHVWRQPCLTR